MDPLKAKDVLKSIFMLHLCFNYRYSSARYVFQAKWDEASKKTIQISTKPCPKCRTPTERDGERLRRIKINSATRL